MTALPDGLLIAFDYALEFTRDWPANLRRVAKIKHGYGIIIQQPKSAGGKYQIQLLEGRKVSIFEANLIKTAEPIRSGLDIWFRGVQCPLSWIGDPAQMKTWKINHSLLEDARAFFREKVLR